MPTAPSPIISGARNDQLQKILRFGGQRPFIPNKLSALEPKKACLKNNSAYKGGTHTFNFAWTALQNSSKPSPFMADMQIIPCFWTSSFTLNGSSVLSICMAYKLGSVPRKKHLKNQLQLEMYNCVLLALLFQISDYWMWRLDRTKWANANQSSTEPRTICINIRDLLLH